MASSRIGLPIVLAAAALVSVISPSHATGQVESQTRSTKSADGVLITYEVHGAGSTTLVFVHGGWCDRTYWRSQIGVFSRDYQVITLDLAGHGASGRTRADWSIANFAEDVVAVVRAVDARNVITIGHSLGGPVSLEAALLMPDRVSGVIGVETFADGWAGNGMRQRMDRIRMNFAVEVHSWVRGMFGPTTSPALVDQVASAMASAPPAIAIPAAEGLLTWALDRQTQAVSALSSPIALIVGGTPSIPKRFQSALKGALLVGVEAVPNAGHFVMQEAPEAFNATLEILLGRLRPRR